MTNSNELQDLLALLRQHRGRDNAITKSSIARRLRLPARRVEKFVRELIVERGVEIASACDPPFGYFIIETEEEGRRYRTQLISRMRSLSDRLRAVDENLASKIQRDLFL